MSSCIDGGGNAALRATPSAACVRASSRSNAVSVALSAESQRRAPLRSNAMAWAVNPGPTSESSVERFCSSPASFVVTTTLASLAAASMPTAASSVPEAASVKAWSARSAGTANVGPPATSPSRMTRVAMAVLDEANAKRLPLASKAIHGHEMCSCTTSNEASSLIFMIASTGYRDFHGAR